MTQTMREETTVGDAPGARADVDPCAGDPDCARAVDHIQTFLDGECGASLEVRIREHLESCPSCLERHDFERGVRAIVASRCKDAAPPGLMDRVRAALDARDA